MEPPSRAWWCRSATAAWALLWWGATMGLSTAQAGELNAGIIRELLDPGAWSSIGSDPAIGLQMYEKPLRSAGLTAYMGVRDLPADVDADRLWQVIVGVDDHVRLGGQLVESTVFHRHGNGFDSYQVLKAPPLMPGAQRYWLVHSEVEIDVAGRAGHRRRCWSNLAPDASASIRAELAQRYPSASAITLTHGCWELLPAEAGTPARLQYRTVSDPGSALARTAVGMLTTRTLPDNMANFIDGARN